MKTRLKNHIRKNSLNHLMLQLIPIESPDELSDSKIDCTVNTWNKNRIV